MLSLLFLSSLIGLTVLTLKLVDIFSCLLSLFSICSSLSVISILLKLFSSSVNNSTISSSFSFSIFSSFSNCISSSSIPSFSRSSWYSSSEYSSISSSIFLSLSNSISSSSSINNSSVSSNCFSFLLSSISISVISSSFWLEFSKITLILCTSFSTNCGLISDSLSFFIILLHTSSASFSDTFLLPSIDNTIIYILSLGEMFSIPKSSTLYVISLLRFCLIFIILYEYPAFIIFEFFSYYS